ncbi:MAG: hypothetical protein IJS48_01015 [Prevotella sp.]|nr:hypothetical protein [Prevotella sp.]
MKKLLMLVCVTILALTASAQKNIYQLQSSQARSMEVISNSYVRPVTVELKIDETKGRIKDVWEITYEEFASIAGAISDRGYSDQQMQRLRDYATFMSSQKHNCDVIVSPIINISTKNLAQGCTITLVGFTANYTNWRTMQDSDIPWIRIESEHPRIQGQGYIPYTRATEQK